MALSARELFEQTRSKFHLRFLCGEEQLDYVVTWAHMTEDTSVAEFFWGNEIVVTSGYAARDEESLLRFIDALMEHRCAGLVINVGKYINAISPRVVDYCRTNHLPLLTMPWEMSITEFVRTCCSLIDKSTRADADLAKAVMHLVRAPKESEAEQAQLSDYFREEQGFFFLTLYPELSDSTGLTARSVLDQRTTLRLRTALRSFSFPYLVFRHHHRFVILLNQTDRAVADEAARRILEAMRAALPELVVQIGVGEPVAAFDQLSNSYHAAVSACRRASIQGLTIVRFRDMGFYKLLYSVPDDGLLRDYYYEVLGPLLEHDQEHNTCYTETLLRYLLTDGSLQAVASAMFTHRNTVGYRMGKIRELLGLRLDTQAERLPFLIAYHAGVILKLVEDLGKD